MGISPKSIPPMIYLYAFDSHPPFNGHFTAGNLLRSGDIRGYQSMARMYTRLAAMPKKGWLDKLLPSNNWYKLESHVWWTLTSVRCNYYDKIFNICCVMIVVMYCCKNHISSNTHAFLQSSASNFAHFSMWLGLYHHHNYNNSKVFATCFTNMVIARWKVCFFFSRLQMHYYPLQRLYTC